MFSPDVDLNIVKKECVIYYPTYEGTFGEQIYSFDNCYHNGADKVIRLYRN